MNVFITGATGFIGRKLVEFIEKDNRFGDIYCLSRKEIDFASDINIIHGSLDNLDNLAPINADVCLHLAAITDSSASDKKDIFKTNAEGTARVVEFCKRSNIPRIVFLSSTNVYLKNKYAYALSKIQAEDYIKKSGLNYSILRCALVYGVGCPSFDKIIDFADHIHMIPVLGTGKSYKQPIRIDDVCRELIKHTFSAGEKTVCDLYGTTRITYNEMVRTILEVNRKRAVLLHLPIKPFKYVSEFCYKFSIPFPVYPEQISHMCEDTCSKTEPESSASDDFFTTYTDMLYKNN